jgi:hypothetical protein
MYLAEGLAVGCSDRVVNDLLLPGHVTLNLGSHVHFIEQNETLAALAKSLHIFVFVDGLCQAGNDERREREGLSCFRFVLSQERARPAHIDFDQSVDHRLVLG